MVRTPVRLIALLAVLLMFGVSPAGATFDIGSWSGLYQGIDYATGTADASEPRLQQVRALRIDLWNPTISFFATPKTSTTLETIGQKTGDFLTQYGLQVAINASFYGPVSDTPTDIDINGLSMSNGSVVSPPVSGFGNIALAITQNNVASLITTTSSTDTSPYWTAVAGSHRLLTNGVNLGDPSSTTAHPRTAVGLTQDNRYLIMLTIDGRQSGYSDGAIDYETALWLVRFGAYNGINLDGGGSTTMACSDGAGGYTLLNSPINGGIPGNQRLNGNSIGVYALPLDVIPEPSTILLVLQAGVLVCFRWRQLR